MNIERKKQKKNVNLLPLKNIRFDNKSNFNQSNGHSMNFSFIFIEYCVNEWDKESVCFPHISCEKKKFFFSARKMISFDSKKKTKSEDRKKNVWNLRLSVNAYLVHGIIVQCTLKRHCNVLHCIELMRCNGDFDESFIIYLLHCYVIRTSM